MCINNYNLGYVMYDSEGKKHRCIKMSKNTKVKNDRKIGVKTKYRVSNMVRKKAKRWKCITGNKPVMKAIGYHRNSEPDPVRKHKYACTVCTTQCVQEYCTKMAYKKAADPNASRNKWWYLSV